MEPCPFCGQHLRLDQMSGVWTHPEQEACLLGQMGIMDSRAKRDAWNRRTSIQQVRAWRHLIAREVWDAMALAAVLGAPEVPFPKYTETGNRFGETEARRTADRILAALTPALEVDPNIARSFPAGLQVDLATYEELESALDRINAPIQDKAGRWLKLSERIQALADPKALP